MAISRKHLVVWLSLLALISFGSLAAHSNAAHAAVPPAFTTPNNATCYENEYCIVYFYLQGQPAAAVTYTGTMPAGVFFFNDNGNDSAILSGTADPGSRGVYSLVFHATNGVPPDATQVFTFTIATVASVTTISPASAVTSSSATLAGNVTDSGGAPVTSRGIVYARNSVNPAPTVGGPAVIQVVDAANSVGVFSESATGLQPSTTYAYRAFVTTSAGTAYGQVFTFSTGAPVSNATLTVHVDFTDTNASLVTVGVTCTGGAFATAPGLSAHDNPDSPAVFTIANLPVGGAACTATNVPVAGYTSNQAPCAVVALTAGSSQSCTIVEALGTDTTPPVLTLPANKVVEATSAGGTVVTFTATALDAVDGPRPVTCLPVSGITFPPGTTTVNCSATDTSNNTANGSFTVKVQDTTPPVISNVPANLNTQATSSSGANVTWPALTANDAVAGGRFVTCVPASGSFFNIGTTTVTCSAQDVASPPNKVTITFTVTVLSSSVFTSVVTGGGHTCALTSATSVLCWGLNDSGQLGDGTKTSRVSPTPAGAGTLFNVTALAVGSSHTCALINDGTVKCWGWNYSGQLGDGTTTMRLLPVPVKNLSNAVAITAGAFHTCALLANGTVKCWGFNDNGQMGDGTYYHQDRLTPVQVLSISGATKITAGWAHTCALVANGIVKCWGANGVGQLGDGNTFGAQLSPVQAVGLTGVTAIAAGNFHTCGLLSNGIVKCWGANYDGPVGNGIKPNNSSDAARVTPETVTGVGSVTAIAAGDSHTCALITGGSLRCWGNNGSGEIGDGTKVNRYLAVPVLGINSAGPVSVGGSSTSNSPHGHTCALIANGGLQCWGDNSFGQLGDGTLTSRLVPTDVLANAGADQDADGIADKVDQTCGSGGTSTKLVKSNVFYDGNRTCGNFAANGHSVSITDSPNGSQGVFVFVGSGGSSPVSIQLRAYPNLNQTKKATIKLSKGSYVITDPQDTVIVETLDGDPAQLVYTLAGLETVVDVQAGSSVVVTEATDEGGNLIGLRVVPAGGGVSLGGVVLSQPAALGSPGVTKGGWTDLPQDPPSVPSPPTIPVFTSPKSGS